MVRVLIVTPTYCTRENKRLPLLLQTVYWIRQQTHTDYEHVVVDDGSTDDTPRILERLARDDARLTVFRQENRGSSAAINFGVSQAVAPSSG